MAEENNPFADLPRVEGAAPSPDVDNPFANLPRAEAPNEDTLWERIGNRVEATVDVATDIGEGVQAGVVGAVKGIAELPAVAFDLAFDTNALTAVNEFFDPIEEFIAPETTAGRVTQDIVNFGATFIPFAGWLSRASQVARGARAVSSAPGRGMLSRFMRSADRFGSSAAGRRLLSTRPRQYTTTALGTGAISSIVSPDGRATLSDSFDVFPDFMRTEADSGLRGRDEAMRNLRNRARQFGEDAVLSGVFDTTLGAFGAAARQTARVPQVAAAANAFNEGLKAAGATITRRFPKAVSVAREYLTPSGGANPILFEEAEDVRSWIRAVNQQATGAVDSYNSAMQRVAKLAKLDIKNPQVIKQFDAEVTNYLEGFAPNIPSIKEPALQKQITSELDRMADIANRQVDNLMAQLEQTAKAGGQQAELAADALKVLKNTKQAQRMHLRRFFEQYTNPVKFYKNLDLASPQAKAAQKEIASNIAAMEGLDVASEAVQERAKYAMLKALQLDANKLGRKGVTESQLIKEKLDAVKAANKGTGRLGSVVAKERPEFVTDRSLFTEREEIIDRSPLLRELMGEITNPIQRYLRTVEDVTRAFTSQRFYDSLPVLGMQRGIVQAVDEVAGGGRPPVVEVPDIIQMTDEQFNAAMQPLRDEAERINTLQGRRGFRWPDQLSSSATRKTAEDVLQDMEQTLRDAGYIKLGEAAANDVFGGLYGSATGKYVSPETYRAITQPLRLNQGFLSEVLGTLSGLRNFTQKMTIVPNIPAQIRNIFGNVGFLAGNANLPNGSDVTDLLYTFLANTKDLNEAGLERLARKMTIAGVSETNLVIRALKEYQEAADDLTFSGTLNRILDRAEGLIPFMRSFEAVYGNSDTFFKGAALLAEEGKLANAFARAGVNQNDPRVLEAFVENDLLTRATSMVSPSLTPMELMAAEIVKDTMPIYTRVVKAVRAIDAVPIVGNFTSFAAENIRNSIGTVMRGVREAAFEATPALRQAIGDQAADILQREIRALGNQRLLAYTTTAYVIPKTMVKMSMGATNTSQEQMNSLYEMNPDYLDGHDLVVIENALDDPNKRFIDYVDLSYVMPYAFMTDPAQAALREIQEKGRADRGTVESVAAGVWRGFQMFADPFASETMFYERLRDVMPQEVLFGRGGVTATGATIYGPGEEITEKARKAFNHLMFGFVPNVATMLVEERSGQLREGRLLRAYTGSPDREGETTNPSKEIARLVSGFTPMRLNLRTDARYKGSEYLPLRNDARGRANRIIRDAAVTQEEINQGWETYLNDLYRAQSQLYRDVEAMRGLNMTDAEIRYSLINQAGLGTAEVNRIMDGRFSPSLAAAETIEEVRNQLSREGRTRVLEEVDWGALRDMTSARMDEPLRTAGEQRPEVLGPRPSVENPFANLPRATTQPAQPVDNPFADLPRAQAQPVPTPTPAPSLPTVNIPSVLPATRQQAVRTAPTVLGESPVDQAANREILERQQD